MSFVSKLCFLCLGPYENNELMLIENNEEIVFHKELKYCLPEIVDSHSAIPKYVCSNCMSKLKCFYKFKQTCLRNNMFLKSYFQTLTLTDETYNQLSMSSYQSLVTLGIHELRNEQKEDCGASIDEVIIKNETEFVEEFDITQSHSLNEEENAIGVKEEFILPTDNSDTEFYHESVESIKCESFLSHSNVSVLRIEDIQEDSKYSTRTSIQNSAINSEEKKETEINEINKTKIFQCPICSREYPHKISLDYHLKLHTSNPDFICAVCDKSFSTKIDLVEHENIHKKFECSICKKKFRQKHNLNQHEKIHFYHDYVKRKYDSYPSNSDDNTTNPEKKVVPYKCLICSREYLYKISFEYHLKVHAGIKDFSCSMCKKSFIRKSHLSQHEKTHTDIRHFECSICNKKFKHKSNLMRHEKVHLNTKNEDVTVSQG